MNRRNFIRNIVITASASIFVPKLIVPLWKRSAECKWISNPAWETAQYELSYMQAMPFYMARINIARNLDYVAWKQFLQAKEWEPNMGDVMRSSKLHNLVIS